MSLVMPQKSFLVPPSIPKTERWKAPGAGKNANLVGYVTDAPAPENLPKPVGFRLVIQVFELKEQTDSGIILAQSTKDGERILAMMGRVVAMGPDAYRDKEKYPYGPWCQQGDAVLIAMHTGQKVSVHGVACRIVNDDEILAVVDEPNAISRG